MVSSLLFICAPYFNALFTSVQYFYIHLVSVLPYITEVFIILFYDVHILYCTVYMYNHGYSSIKPRYSVSMINNQWMQLTVACIFKILSIAVSMICCCLKG